MRRRIDPFDVACLVAGVGSVIAVTLFQHNDGTFWIALLRNTLIGLFGYMLVYWMGDMIPIVNRFLHPKDKDNDNQRK